MFRQVIAVSLLLAATPALADESWFSMNNKEKDQCGFGGSFEGDDLVVIFQTKSLYDRDMMGLVVSNDRWSVKKDDKLTDTYKVDADGGWFSDGAAIAIDHGFIMTVPTKSFGYVFDDYPSAIAIYKGKTLIGRYNLAGLIGQMIKFRDCQRPWVEAKAKAAHERELAKFPQDPFAKPAAAPAPAVKVIPKRKRK